MMQSTRGVSLYQGEVITLAASAARASDGNGSWVYIGGERHHYAWILDITASATDLLDTLDVYIDASFNGVDSVGNVAHFTQQPGNGSAAAEMAITSDASAAVTTTIMTEDAVAGTVRPGLIAPYFRARWEIADSGISNSSHTFSIIGYAL